MPRVLLLIIFLLLQCCEINDDSNNNDGYDQHFEILPVVSVDLPDSFVIGQSYQVSMAYILPTNCHFFNDIYYVSEDNSRTVAIISEVINSPNCTQSNSEAIATFNFVPRETGAIIFKFWQGQNENEEDQYLEITVPITE